MNQFEKRLGDGSPQLETKLCIIVDDQTPIIMKVPTEPRGINLAQFKDIISLPRSSEYKYYFRSKDEEFGIVKEEVIDDDATLPVEGGRIVAWVISTAHNHTALFEDLEPDEVYESVRPCIPGPSFFDPSHLQFGESATSMSYEKDSHNRYIDVHLLLDNYNFLGLTIVGPSEGVQSSADQGIYVGNITKDSVVERTGRVQVGDKIIRINGIDLQTMKNGQAVSTFKHCVAQRGAISLILERSDNDLQSQQFEPRHHHNQTLNKPTQGELPYPMESIEDIPVPEQHADPVPIISRPLPKISHAAQSLPRSITPRSLYRHGGSENSASYHESPITLTSRSVYETSTTPSLRSTDITLHCKRHDVSTILAAMRTRPDGLEVRDREWLKVIVKDAFLGSQLVKWLSRNVRGFSSRTEIKAYANRMLSMELIKNPITSGTFSERCYYTFC